MPLLNVRLDTEDKRLADDLREQGIPISRVVREAIRAEHAKRVGSRARSTKPSALVARLFEEFPDDEDASPTPTPPLDDRSAVQRAIQKRLRAKAPKR